MTQQLMVKENPNLSPSASEFAVMKEQATMLIKSQFLPPSIKTPEQAIAIILTGRELGIGTMQALNNITVISGKPTVSPQLMLALIQRSGQLENFHVQTKHGTDGAIAHVACTMKRRGMHEHTEIFGAAEANKMGLLGKDNYKKQPATMFKWRAVAACARVVFPDVILGFYTPEEMGADVDISDTEEITAAPPAETSRPIVVQMPQPKPQETIQVEPVFEQTVAQTPTDYTAEWKEKLDNPTVIKEVAPVSPAVKGKLLVEGGYVARTNAGFEVTNPDGGDVSEVLRRNNKVICNCEDFLEGRKHNDIYRCACIEAVKLYILQKPQQQAA